MAKFVKKLSLPDGKVYRIRDARYDVKVLGKDFCSSGTWVAGEVPSCWDHYTIGSTEYPFFTDPSSPSTKLAATLAPYETLTDPDGTTTTVAREGRFFLQEVSFANINANVKKEQCYAIQVSDTGVAEDDYEWRRASDLDVVYIEEDFRLDWEF